MLTILLKSRHESKVNQIYACTFHDVQLYVSDFMQFELGSRQDVVWLQVIEDKAGLVQLSQGH